MTEPSATSSQPSGATLQPSRIAAKFAECKANGRAAFMPYLTVGYPTLARSVDLIEAIVAGGADLIEIGVPFSDPLADGTTIQAASQKALDQGVTLQDCFDVVKEARARGVEIPLLLMGYSNPFYQYGLERLAQTAAEVGVDGFIIPDLPSDESEEFAAPLRKLGRDLIFLLAPTSTEKRIQDAADRASGFIYCVSLTGVTGARNALAGGLPEYIARVRAHTDLPLAIGFGISRPEHVREAAALADGVIVGAALINHIDTLTDAELSSGTAAFVRRLVDATGPSQSGAAETAREQA
ncbi:MAG: tryptophan synthase subunit alpha [Thermomicrobiales bacterium]|nr:tryptophan synthase subunit alpha [Thermomicrobiales bacterium]